MSDKSARCATGLNILEEPDWAQKWEHTVGSHGRDVHPIGITDSGGEWNKELSEIAEERFNELRDKVNRGNLVTVRDMMEKQQDFHIDRPPVHPCHSRYVLHTTESFLKEAQPWAINQKKWEQQARAKEEAERKNQQTSCSQQGQQTVSDGDCQEKMDEISERERSSGAPLSPEEQGLLELLRSERVYRSSMGRNDGKGRSPLLDEELPSQIDEADQFTPDNWIPRSDKLIRLTGKHPLNAEADLTTLFDAGFITPSPIHFVRNHGAVPHLLWENHSVEVMAGLQVKYLMDNLVREFDSINIPVFLACDGNRRKELNMMKATKSFNYTGAAASCSYWKGVRLCDVLKAADVDRLIRENGNSRLWVHYEGSDKLSEGLYATCIPLEYAMDASNDVILAYMMNDRPIPPDHGYPLRMILPGWVGARSVKWLARIWVSNKENDSYYYIYDNRQLPSFITDGESEIADTMFHHPNTICNKQMLNSVIVRPTQGERIDLANIKKGKKYRIEGIAYNGSGEEVERVEVSLDSGETWFYCVRRYPSEPIRHGQKFWTWLRWYIDIDITRLACAPSIVVRAFDVHKNTQPPKPIWNIQGIMNNSWYEVKPEIFEDSETYAAHLLFRHPVEAGNGVNGWMKQSLEQQIEQIKRDASAPAKQFTRQEIERHRTEDDCWIVVNGNVYDATSVLSWHPGGKGPVLSHAGAVHLDTSDEFEGIHDDFAWSKLQECIIGKVTDTTMDHMKRDFEKKTKERAESGRAGADVALNKHKWIQARLLSKEKLSHDTHRYKFGLPAPAKRLGLEIGQHFQVGFHFYDRLIYRTYTPVRPIMDDEDDGTFDLVVKTYYPTENQPGGTMSNLLDCLRIGQEIEVKGPGGEIRYRGNGWFAIDNVQYHFNNITLILGGSGVTPGFQVISRILKEKDDHTRLKVIDANNTEADILLRGDFDEFAEKHSEQFEIVHVLTTPGEQWKGPRGFVTKDIIHEHAFPPGEKNMALLCGPPVMIQKAVLPVLKEWGYEDSKNMFGF